MKFKSLLLVVGFIPAMVMAQAQAQAPVPAEPVTSPVATAPVAVKPTLAPAKPALTGEQNNIFNDI